MSLNRLEIEEYIKSIVKSKDDLSDVMTLYKYFFTDEDQVIKNINFHKNGYSLFSNLGLIIDYFKIYVSKRVLPKYLYDMFLEPNLKLNKHVNLSLLVLSYSYYKTFFNSHIFKHNKKEYKQFLPHRILIKNNKFMYSINNHKLRNGTYKIDRKYNDIANKVFSKDPETLFEFRETSTAIKKLKDYCSIVAEFLETKTKKDRTVFEGCILAGGSVISHLDKNVNKYKGDLDMYVYGSEEYRIKKIIDITVKLNKLGYEFYHNGFIIQCNHPKNEYPEVQIMNTLFERAFQVVDYFDLSHTQIFFNGKDIYATSLWFNNTLHGYSQIDRKVMESYRLVKALQKGFIVVKNPKEDYYFYNSRVSSLINKDEEGLFYYINANNKMNWFDPKPIKKSILKYKISFNMDFKNMKGYILSSNIYYSSYKNDKLVIGTIKDLENKKDNTMSFLNNNEWRKFNYKYKVCNIKNEQDLHLDYAVVIYDANVYGKGLLGGCYTLVNYITFSKTLRL